MVLRIHSGEAGGRYIKARPRGPEVRPILARIRKSLFDILRPRLAGSRFLDVYAGTGTVGIEALSNGAAEVVFVDASRDSCRMVEDNLAHLGFAARAQVVRADAVRELRFVGARVFDFIFMGPPYKDDQKKPLALTLPTLEALGAAGLAGPDTWVIGQHHKKEPVAPLPPGWVVFREKEYGDSVLTFFQRKA